MSTKHPVTPAGIETVTFRFVAQHLNHCATAVPSVYGEHVNHVCCIILYGRFEILISGKDVSGALGNDAVKSFTVTDVSGDLSTPLFRIT